ncbi:MAG: hypothetical protein B6229_07390 [Spirochaetaceae bacterium 4572_7]|nr:MAG: hypothetical protein B6229_07390 [Spirochaetaceae bacterium 4572_7]
MERDNIVELGSYISKTFLSKRITPLDFIKKIAILLPGESKNTLKIFLTLWNKGITSSGDRALDISHPLILSRGLNENSDTTEQLLHYLPEEKILINQEIFRGHLDKVNLVDIDKTTEQRLISTLSSESIGLSSNDVLLYYNLIKINQLSQSQNSNNQNISENNVSTYPAIIYKLATDVFFLNNSNIRKVNGGKTIEDKAIIDVLSTGIKKGRINPQVLALCLGNNNNKFIEFFKGFVTLIVSQRGGDTQEILSYIGLYILLNGASDKELSTLDLASHTEAYILDRIGRVRSVYYVSMLFIHTFNVILAAQVYEISIKYQNSSLDQRLKLEKLYSADNRRQLLISNATNIATRKISSYKNESLEVLSAFKRYISGKKGFVTVSDLFKNDYR